MTEEKFDPIKEFTTLRDTLSKAVGQGVKGMIGLNHVLVDIYETETDLVVRTSPIDGIQADSLEVSVENDILTISGVTVADDDIPEDGVYLLQERKFGTFSRAIKLPRAVESEAAQARFKQGVLTVRFPKIVDARPQVIEITPVE